LENKINDLRVEVALKEGQNKKLVMCSFKWADRVKIILDDNW